MSKVVIDDNILKNACGELSAAIIKGYDIENIPKQSFSDDFIKSIEVLFVKNRQKTMFKNFLVRAAILFLVAAITGTIIFTTNAEARSYVMRIIKEITHGNTYISVVNNSETKDLCDIEFGWIPNDIVKVERIPGLNYTIVIASSKDPDKSFFMIYEKADENSFVQINSENSKTIVLNNSEAILFEKTSEDPSCNLFWINEEKGVFIELDSTYDEDILIKVAKNLILK